MPGASRSHPQGEQCQWPVVARPVPGHLGDQVIFVDYQRRGRQLTGEKRPGLDMIFGAFPASLAVTAASCLALPTLGGRKRPGCGRVGRHERRRAACPRTAARLGRVPGRCHRVDRRRPARAGDSWLLIARRRRRLPARAAARWGFGGGFALVGVQSMTATQVFTQRSAAPAVRVAGVIKRVGPTVALAGVDLEVAEGTVFGLLGPNGAGKTTLVRVLATLLAPDSGHAEVFGRNVVSEAPAVREMLGLTGQFAAVDEILTGRENLQMFGRLFDLSRAEARRRAGELLERFDLADAADRSARTYSGGMRRRLDLASSLLTRPRILFLDEPTTGLDPRSRNEIWGIVRELVRDGTTVLLTTQYLEEADQLADRIAVIDHGRVIAQGTGNELKDRVGGQILEVELSTAAQRDQAQAVLARVGCGNPEPSERPDRLTLPAPRDGLELIEDAAAALRRAGIGVSDLGLRRPTLDDVFLQLTGAPPSEDGAGPEASASAGRAPATTGAASAADRGARPFLPLHRPSLLGVRSAVTDARIVTGRNLRHFI